jgi:hypothetical protein
LRADCRSGAAFLLEAEVARVRGQCGVHAGGFHRGGTAGAGRRPGGAAHGTDQDLAGRGLDHGDGVAGVDRPVEAVRAVHRHDVGDLADAQQRGDARREVLAEGRVGRQHVAVAAGLGQLGDLRRQHRGQRAGVGGVGHGQHLGHAGELGGLRGRPGRVGGQYDDVDLAADLGRAVDRARGAGIELAVAVLGNHQNLAHTNVLSAFLSFRRRPESSAFRVAGYRLSPV